jgi:hypothetical protein
MAIKRKNGKREENLRIMVLRKTVSIKDFKRQPQPKFIQKSSEGKEKLKEIMKQMKNNQTTIEKCDHKKSENSVTESKKYSENQNFTIRLIAANALRKFGLVRHKIGTIKGQHSGIKSGKTAKLMYL